MKNLLTLLSLGASAMIPAAAAEGDVAVKELTNAAVVASYVALCVNPPYDSGNVKTLILTYGQTFEKYGRERSQAVLHQVLTIAKDDPDFCLKTGRRIAEALR